MTEGKFGYEEPKNALNTRIAAHAKYSNFNLHEWMKQRFHLQPGDRILDLGCGNGNFTQLFWDFVHPSGVVIGIDKNPSLIEAARSRFADLPDDHVRFLIHDFDEPFPDLGASFDWIFAIYSIYYTADSAKILQTMRELMKPGATFVVIGPGPENVKDLTAFNTQMTGKEPDQEHAGRIERIAVEFQPLFRQIFGEAQVNYEEVDSRMEFPDAESYCDYYWSTLLWRQSIEGLSAAEVKTLKKKTVQSITFPARIQKQMSCLIGKDT
ncbi:MAG: class I SAM-dependent methyltransferase [Anaerolineales bacterium]